METILDALMNWIAAETERDLTAMRPPVVVEMSLAELTSEFYSDQPFLAPEDGTDERLRALYAATDGANGTVYLLSADTYDDAEHFENPYDNPLWQEVLLHELVHHVQWQTGDNQNWLCNNFGELEAYQLGGWFLSRTGTPDPFPNRHFWANIYARC